MTAKLRADVSYSGFICKNPLHRHWIVLPSDHLFTLPELHGSSPRRGCAHGTRNVAGPVARRASGAPTLIASGPGRPWEREGVSRRTLVPEAGGVTGQ